jgi:hypothetical protein
VICSAQQVSRDQAVKTYGPHDTGLHTFMVSGRSGPVDRAHTCRDLAGPCAAEPGGDSAEALRLAWRWRLKKAGGPGGPVDLADNGR